jgi:recombinase
MKRVRVALDSDGSVTTKQIEDFAARHGLHVDRDLGRVDEQIGVLEIRDAMAVVILPIDAEAPDAGPTVAATAVAAAAGELSTGRRAASAPGIRGAVVGALPAISVGLASALIAQRAMRRQAEDRRKSGLRRGPRPHKPPRALIEVISSRLDEGASYRMIADELTAAGTPTPSGGSWWPATVKRLLDTSLKETRIVLTRLGSLLADVAAADSLSHDDLVALGERHRFHHRRLLEAFESGWSAPHTAGFTPPIQRQGNRYTLSENGKHLLAIWERSEQLDDRIEDIVLGLQRHGGTRGTTPTVFERLCSTAGVAVADVPAEYVEFRTDTGAFHLTDEGADVARTWAKVVDRDPNKRLDIDFWPESHEEAARWDWEDDPLTG